MAIRSYPSSKQWKPSNVGKMATNRKAGEPPVAIAVTISRGCIADQPKGYRGLVQAFEESDGENSLFYFRLSNKPRFQCPTIYFVIGNRVRWRATVIDHLEGASITFNDGRDLYGKGWVTCIDFQRIRGPERKGFQGFRYLYEEEATYYERL